MTEKRSERTIGVTAKIAPVAARNLWVLANSETWRDVLDVLERGCIEIETKLINTPVENRAAVLENHKLSQAAWVIFEYFQTAVLDAGKSYLSSVAPQPVAPRLTPEEEERDYILNPIYSPTLTEEEIGSS